MHMEVHMSMHPSSPTLQPLVLASSKLRCKAVGACPAASGEPGTCHGPRITMAPTLASVARMAHGTHVTVVG